MLHTRGMGQKAIAIKMEERRDSGEVTLQSANGALVYGAVNGAGSCRVGIVPDCEGQRHSRHGPASVQERNGAWTMSINVLV